MHTSGVYESCVHASYVQVYIILTYMHLGNMHNRYTHHGNMHDIKVEKEVVVTFAWVTQHECAKGAIFFCQIYIFASYDTL